MFGLVVSDMTGIDNEVIVWDKRREEYLDFLRVNNYKFRDPEDSFGRPDVDEDIEIYGWANVPFDPSTETQSRRYFGLKSTDLGGEDFTLDGFNPKTYPDGVIDAHHITEGGYERIKEPTPKLEPVGKYKLTEIPDMVHPEEDTIRFDTAVQNGFSVELHKPINDVVRLNLNRDFSTYTLIWMSKEIDEFELPPQFNSQIVSNQI